MGDTRRTIFQICGPTSATQPLSPDCAARFAPCPSFVHQSTIVTRGLRRPNPIQSNPTNPTHPNPVQSRSTIIYETEGYALCLAVTLSSFASGLMPLRSASAHEHQDLLPQVDRGVALYDLRSDPTAARGALKRYDKTWHEYPREQTNTNVHEGYLEYKPWRVDGGWLVGVLTQKKKTCCAHRCSLLRISFLSVLCGEMRTIFF